MSLLYLKNQLIKNQLAIEIDMRVIQKLEMEYFIMTKQFKQMSIDLITDVKEDGELVTTTYKTKGFIPFSKLMKITKKLEGMDKLSEQEAMEETFKVICEDLYENQFTVEQLMDGLHAPDAAKVIEENITFLSTGELPKKEDKK